MPRHHPYSKPVNSPVAGPSGYQPPTGGRGEKRAFEEDSSAESATQAEPGSVDTNSSQADSEMPAGNEPQAGGSKPGGTGSNVQATIIHNPKQKPTSMVFRKTFQVYTGGFQFAVTSPDPFYSILPIRNFFRGDTAVLATPLGVLNPNQIEWYMNPIEMDNLPDWSFATHVKVKVTPLGYRLPFATNEAESSFANSQTLVQIATAVGLNNQFYMCDGNYTTEASDLTRPVTQDNPGVLQGILYGNAGGAIGANVGIPRHLANYTSIVYDNHPGLLGGANSPNLLQSIDVQNVIDCKGVPVINFDHTFSNGMLKWPNLPVGGTNPVKTQQGMLASTTEGGPRIPTGTNGGYFFDRRPRLSTTATTSNMNFYGPQEVEFQLSGAQFPVTGNIGIEKSKWWTRTNVCTNNVTALPEVPLVHFGCMPVQSNAALSPTPTFANVVIQWLIQTEMEVEIPNPYVQPDRPSPYLNFMDPTMNYNLSSYNLNNQGAYISNQRLITNVNPYTKS